MPEPEFGEIWWVDFEPAAGSEARKTRPALVVSAPEFDHLRVRIVVPLTSWQHSFQTHQNKIRVAPSDQNGLEVDSALDAMLIRSVALERFRLRVGAADSETLAEALGTLRLVIPLG